MGFKFQMGMGMKSLKWEGTGTKIYSRTPLAGTQQTPKVCTVWCARRHPARQL